MAKTSPTTHPAAPAATTAPSTPPAPPAPAAPAAAPATPATPPAPAAPPTPAAAPAAGSIDVAEAARWAGVGDDAIHSLMDRNEAAVRALPGFAPPKTRAAAIALLVRVGVKAPAGGEVPAAGPAAAPAGPKRFQVRVSSPVFNGTRAGLTFRDGCAETDDAKAAEALRSLGYDVRDRDKIQAMADAAGKRD